MCLNIKELMFCWILTADIKTGGVTSKKCQTRVFLSWKTHPESHASPSRRSVGCDTYDHKAHKKQKKIDKYYLAYWSYVHPTWHLGEAAASWYAVEERERKCFFFFLSKEYYICFVKRKKKNIKKNLDRSAKNLDL